MKREMKTLKIEKIWSPIKDRHIKNNINNSPIWNSCLHHEDALKDNKIGGFIYTIYFDGMKPISVTSVKKFKR
jgi:hypothetical protein|tara:strand:- start:1096 stop:1314 length:219 start_codon:yes stop_codon:yes gene_type:complete